MIHMNVITIETVKHYGITTTTQRKTTFCNKFKLLALQTICANVSNSESSTSHFNICPILVNLGRESKSLRAEMSVKDEFFSWKLSSLPIEFLHKISSRKKSLKKVALVSKCTSRTSKSGHAENRIECNQFILHNHSTRRYLFLTNVKISRRFGGRFFMGLRA